MYCHTDRVTLHPECNPNHRTPHITPHTHSNAHTRSAGQALCLASGMPPLRWICNQSAAISAMKWLTNQSQQQQIGIPPVQVLEQTTNWFFCVNEVSAGIWLRVAANDENTSEIRADENTLALAGPCVSCSLTVLWSNTSTCTELLFKLDLGSEVT